MNDCWKGNHQPRHQHVHGFTYQESISTEIIYECSLHKKITIIKMSGKTMMSLNRNGMGNGSQAGPVDFIFSPQGASVRVPMSFPKPVVSFRPPVPRRSNTTRPESDTEKEEASSPMTGSGEGKRVSLAPSARLRPDANPTASKNRPVSVGLNRDFLAALDKSLGTEKRASVAKSMSTTEDVPTTRPKPPSRPSHRRSVSVTHPGGTYQELFPRVLLLRRHKFNTIPPLKLIGF